MTLDAGRRLEGDDVSDGDKRGQRDTYELLLPGEGWRERVNGKSEGGYKTQALEVLQWCCK